jgi:hypothetical protein
MLGLLSWLDRSVYEDRQIKDVKKLVIVIMVVEILD